MDTFNDAKVNATNSTSGMIGQAVVNPDGTVNGSAYSQGKGAGTGNQTAVASGGFNAVDANGNTGLPLLLVKFVFFCAFRLRWTVDFRRTGKWEFKLELDGRRPIQHQPGLEWDGNGQRQYEFQQLHERYHASRYKRRGPQQQNRLTEFVYYITFYFWPKPIFGYF